MKKIIFSLLILSAMLAARAQNGVYGPLGLYTPQNTAATTIFNGGSILVGNGGNWAFAGNVTSNDKTNVNAPTANGRLETITFDGTGTYSGAANGATTVPAASPQSGFMVDGYAAVTASVTGVTTLPIGDGTNAYSVAVPAGSAVAMAYFDGLGATNGANANGTSQSVASSSIANNFTTTGTTTVFSPYIDVASTQPAGSYTLSYPSGFTGGNNAILSSLNSAGSGTNGSTAWSLLAQVANYGTTSGTVTVKLAAGSATQLYFSTSTVMLPVALIGFAAISNGCMANLAWQTASEGNSSYYAVEAGLDGSSFAQVGKVASRSSPTGASYTYAQTLGSGTNYFRLRAVDRDGSSVYSQVVAVTGTGACSVGSGVKVSPNPASAVANITGLVLGSTVSLYNINGKKMTSVVATSTSQSINIGMFTNGEYILRISALDGTVSNLKLVKD